MSCFPFFPESKDQRHTEAKVKTKASTLKRSFLSFGGSSHVSQIVPLHVRIGFTSGSSDATESVPGLGSLPLSSETTSGSVLNSLRLISDKAQGTVGVKTCRSGTF